MAATLMMIKSRMLLPVEERPELEAEEEDPRWDLVRQLIEYKKFKDAATRLEEITLERENVFGLGGPAVVFEPEAGVVLQDVSLFDLIAAFRDVLKNARPEEIREIYSENFTVADKVELILRRIGSEKQMRFSELFHPLANRYEIVCTFLALLELIRLRQVNIRQKKPFEEIMIEAVEDGGLNS
jgi:segregation and condensation protein A